MKLIIKHNDKREKISFRKYTDIADYLDKNPPHKDAKIHLFNSKYGLPVNVKFDGVFTWIEGRGFI